MLCISQLTYKMQLKRYSISQSARLDGILNAPGHRDVHTQVSGPYSLKLCELWVHWAVWGQRACPSWKQAVKASVSPGLGRKPSRFVPHGKVMGARCSQSLQLENVSSVQYGRQSVNSPRILSSASVQTATVSCWMGIISSTVLQYFNRII